MNSLLKQSAGAVLLVAATGCGTYHETCRLDDPRSEAAFHRLRASTPLPPSRRDRVHWDRDLPFFDPQFARAAFNQVDVSTCRAAGAPAGYGHARVTINPDGRISKVVVDEPAGMPNVAAQCIGRRLGSTTVTPFKGSLVTMGTTYHVPKN